MKKIAFVFLLLLIFFPLASQTTGTDSVTESDLVTESPFEKSFFEATDFFVGFTPLAYISTENDNKGGPSSIVYPLYFGIAWPRDYWISIQPSLKIFTDYYLVSEGKVYPAEIENRTGLGFSFLLNVPVVFQANFWDKSNLKLSAGIALLFRFAAYPIPRRTPVLNALPQRNKATQAVCFSARFLLRIRPFGSPRNRLYA